MATKDEREYQREIVEELKKDPEFMKQVKQGMKDRREGKVVLWDILKKQLGL